MLPGNGLSLRDCRAETEPENLGAGAPGTAHELAPSPVFNCLPYIAQAHLPRDGAAHSALGPSTFIDNQKFPHRSVLDGSNSLTPRFTH